MQQILIKTAAHDEKREEAIPVSNIPEELIFTAQQKITLRCGKSSITLHPNGKVVIKGDYILSDAEGVNRLSGGRIEVN
ncbi:hypothetical protein RHD99_21875 [Buttiauxella selenatireducens]|uniref:DUF2345 domain-containing protein n=1 Tax=Buttiauxella selenatireducens TaxID=3073902 RepID=A0ABY9S963_9ENTR|nr:hypothetical protein [Buttiauxella sp. R73]WMY74044.1 hypothetical protein RHD99_21875 [Buttiauxella sp. R73]